MMVCEGFRFDEAGTLDLLLDGTTITWSAIETSMIAV